MPTISVDKQDLFDYLNQEFTTEEFDKLCFEFGLELDEDTSLNPVIVNGVQERPVLKIEVAANRYDMLCFEGIAQALSIFQGKTKIPHYKLSQPSKVETLTILPETMEIRPYAAAAILRGIKFTERRYQSFISLQDKLHSNLARNRTLVAIGTHDLSKVKGPFTYEALKPEDIKFTPLNQTKEMNGKELMEFYENDKHLGKFLHIIRDSPVYPVIYDSQRRVLSLPPIINGDLSKISINTTDVFIECTATDKTKLEIVINMMVAMFSMYTTEPYTIEPVQISSDHNHCTRSSPNVIPRSMTAEVSYINACTGLTRLPADLANLLGRMCILASPSPKNKDILDIDVPITRSDILHQCDLMEDVAIAHGYNDLPRPTFLRSATVGAPLPMNKLSDIVRKEVALAGWTEVMSLILCSHDENYKFLRREDDKRAVVLANPKTFEYQVVRTTLLPGILKTLRENKAMGLPVGVFEVSDVVVQDHTRERMARNERRWAGIWLNKTAGFEIVHGLLDRYVHVNETNGRVMQILDVKLVANTGSAEGYWIEGHDEPTFFPGRSAIVKYRTPDGNVVQLGSFGILHPEVLANFEINYPGSAVEINLEPFL